MLLLLLLRVVAASGFVAARGGLVSPTFNTRADWWLRVADWSSRRSIRERIGGCAWQIGILDAQYASGLVAARGGLVSTTLNTPANWEGSTTVLWNIIRGTLF